MTSELQFPTNADRVCANAIAAALTERYGYVRLSVRFSAARYAMDLAQLDAEAVEDREARWRAENGPAA